MRGPIREGHVTGADDVGWSPRRAVVLRVALALAAVAVVAVAVVVMWRLQQDNRTSAGAPGRGQPDPRRVSSPPPDHRDGYLGIGQSVPTSGTSVVPGASASWVLQQALDAKYQACVIAGRFDPGGVQVLVGTSGRPEWVKTGRDVPAGIHRPCFALIGGADQPHSSHGYPG